MSEYQQYVKLSVAKKKYSEKIDDKANKIAAEIAKKFEDEKDFKKVAEFFKDSEIVDVESLSELVDVTNLDSGRAEEAMKLKETGDISDKFLSDNGDGYYFVKLTAREGNKVKYDSIRVRFTEFDKRINQIKADGKIKEYITLESVDDDKSDESESDKKD
jgi:hypothetical protein